MSEMRSTTDCHRSFFPSGQGSSAPVFGAIQPSLARDISKVVSGEIEPKELARQLPDHLRVLLGLFASTHYSKSIDLLSSEEYRAVFKLLGELIEEMDATSQKTGLKIGVTTDCSEPGQRRSEMRVDSSQSYYPSSSRNLGSSEHTLWSRIAVVAVAVALLAAGAFAIWRWLA